jgi:hypothetical protein
MSETVQVGAQIEAQCGRCHDATQHVVLTIDKGKPKRARCNACDAEHLYRKPKGPEAPRAGGRGSSKDDSKATWEKAMNAAAGEAVKYAVKGRFSEGQRLTHKSFGEGVVLRVVRPGVAEVLFEDGPRLLAMDR